MYAWLLAGVALGIVLSSLIRRIPHSQLAELIYVTLLSAWDDRKQKRARKSVPAREPEVETKQLRAVASRFTLF